MLTSPYWWFGGKRRVAHHIWAALGECDLYVEPFFGSLSLLLARPPQTGGRARYEVVNDKDGFAVNFWRAIKADPDAVA